MTPDPTPDHDTPEAHAKRIINRHDDGDGADRPTVARTLDHESGMGLDSAEQLLDLLEKHGEIYAPRDGRLRVTDTALDTNADR